MGVPKGGGEAGTRLYQYVGRMSDSCRSLGVCVCVCVSLTFFFVNQHIQNPYLSNKFFPRDDDDGNICRSRRLCSKILSRCCVLYAATCILVIRRSLGFYFEY